MMLSTDLQKGGLPLQLLMMARYFPAVEVHPIVGCLATRGPLSDVLESHGVETFACDAAGPLDIRCFGRFRQHVRRFDPDLIHSSLFHANLVARLFGRTDRTRPILTTTLTIEIERRWHRWLESLTSGLSDLHVANAEAVRRHVCEDLGFAPGDVLVIPNGLEMSELDRVTPAQRRELGIEDDLPLIVWAGRMDPVKNLETFVEVVARVHSQRRLRALLLGDGPAYSKIKTEVNKRGLEGVVHFAGWSDKVSAWLKASDVLLFPSWTEGAPNVVLEAMACRCPVVASNVAACPEFITTGRNGVLCSPNDVDGFVRSVLGLLADPLLRKRYADVAYDQLSAGYSIQDVVCQWRAAYDRLMTSS